MNQSSPSFSVDYFILVGLLSCGIVGYFIFLHQPVYQLVTVVLTAVCYVGWGIWHHQRTGGLYWPVILEYILISSLVVALTWALVL